MRGVIVLTMITLISGFLLGVVYFVTEEPIRQAKNTAKQKAYATVLPNADSFEASEGESVSKMDDAMKERGIEKVSFTEAAQGLDSKGKNCGYVITVTSHEGYGGDIVLSVGVETDGTVSGVEMLSISETAGLGMKAAEPAFKSQFSGKNVPSFSYTKSGGAGNDTIDALSGATITTNAVTNAVNGALVCFRELKGGE